MTPKLHIVHGGARRRLRCKVTVTGVAPSDLADLEVRISLADLDHGDHTWMPAHWVAAGVAETDPIYFSPEVWPPGKYWVCLSLGPEGVGDATTAGQVLVEH